MNKWGKLTTAQLDWFDDGCCDVKYLDLWQDVPLSCSPGAAADESWHHDHFERVIGRDESGLLFQNAADRLMRYQFYPQHILSHVGEFDLGDSRLMTIGDRIVQRIHLLSLWGFNILDVIGLVEVNQIVDEPRCQGFTYVTTAVHVEQGEWSAQVSWSDDGTVTLLLDALSRPDPLEPARNHRFMRNLQKKAHRQGIAHFTTTVLT